MKNNIIKLFVFAAALALTGCVQDLNTEPISKSSSTVFNEGRMFTKCYATLGTASQKNAADDGDVDDIDVGTSAFYRTIWYCNELPADQVWWIWDDDCAKIQLPSSWKGDDVLLRGIYARLNLTVKYCNHYLAYAGNSTQDEKYRYAEIRFIRALNYYYLMDFFLYAPRCLEESTESPHYWSRWELYSWLVGELKELTKELPAHRISEYRVDQTTAWMLLARIYLNADVYNRCNTKWTKDQTWELAYAAADTALMGGYSLYTTSITADSGYVYTAYQQLFMGDNNRAEVANECPLMIYQDGIYCQNYGGAIMLTAAPRTDGMVAFGCQKTWTCIRTSPTLVYLFSDLAGKAHTEAAALKYDEYHMPQVLKDDRAIMCSYTPDAKKEWQLIGEMGMGSESHFFDCWAIPKFTNVYSTAATPAKSVGRDTDFPETDIPFFRIAEAYMTKAEAAYRLGKSDEALNIINNVIRARANAAPLAAIDNDKTILDEWGREFFSEGRRRIDLIRFDRFYGPESDVNGYTWEGRAGQTASLPFKSGTNEFWNWYPVPTEDKNANPNFKTDVEGAADNPYAGEGGDGYTY